mmetsp:Transcript_55104/g.112686  ORF Transcript_55104/g.112686 Transcript_55104/m.112686 type:complete len:113 (-) Transcript_55104:82-420(-)
MDPHQVELDISTEAGAFLMFGEQHMPAAQGDSLWGTANTAFAVFSTFASEGTVDNHGHILKLPVQQSLQQRLQQSKQQTSSDPRLKRSSQWEDKASEGTNESPENGLKSDPP